MRILVFNCGSSSLKFELIEMEVHSGQLPLNIRRLARGTFEEIGPHASIRMSDESGHQLEQSEPITDHKVAAVRAIDWLGQLGSATIDAVAHRIVHGGEHVTEPALATDAIMSALGEASEFAPLHNPPAIAAIRAVAEKLPGVPAVIVTDTGFHRNLPAAARNYAIPRLLAERYGIRRFGFHGIGHAWMLRAMCGDARDRAGEAQPDHPAFGCGMLGRRNQARAFSGYLDGPDAARRPDDGHALGRY